ncbi:MAG TPA: hypothetical protein VNC40_16160 [Gaiellaceae bacterium]|nr:hypothetical protein [Gaiellaceae bacterium]
MGTRARCLLMIPPLFAAVALAGYGAGAGRSTPGGNAHPQSAPIDCATAKALARAVVRPVWFPVPQPPGRLVLNADVPMFGPGLKWASGRHYVFLDRVPGGANLGEPFPTKAANPYLANFRGKVAVLRLAKVEGGRLFAEWPTLGRPPDLTAAVANGETVSQFVAFLGSLRRITWPTRCRASAAG